MLLSRKGLRAWTLLEMMFAVATFSIAGAAVASAYIFSLRSFQAVSNYAVLDQDNREAMDRITREIRSARAVVFHTNSDTFSMLTVKDAGYNDISYTFDFPNRQLKRTSPAGTKVMLDNCHLLKFNLGTRAPGAGFTYTNATRLDQAKLVDLTWKTYRTLPGGVTNSEYIQTAKIAIRKHKISQAAP
jgi:hypothetical protein